MCVVSAAPVRKMILLPRSDIGKTSMATSRSTGWCFEFHHDEETVARMRIPNFPSSPTFPISISIPRIQNIRAPFMTKALLHSSSSLRHGLAPSPVTTSPVARENLHYRPYSVTRTISRSRNQLLKHKHTHRAGKKENRKQPVRSIKVSPSSPEQALKVQRLHTLRLD